MQFKGSDLMHDRMKHICSCRQSKHSCKKIFLL